MGGGGQGYPCCHLRLCLRPPLLLLLPPPPAAPSGKSLTTIALLHTYFAAAGHQATAASQMPGSADQEMVGGGVGRALLVVPSNVLFNFFQVRDNIIIWYVCIVPFKINE